MHIVTYMVCGKRNIRILYVISKEENSGVRDFYLTPVFWFARHGRALTGESPEHTQIVGSV